MIKTFAAIGLIATFAVPALAEGHVWQIGNDSFHIHYTDLDMNTTTGRASLLQRVERAAKRLCRDRSFRSLCIAETIRGASRDATSGAPIRLALTERNGVVLAAR